MESHVISTPQKTDPLCSGCFDYLLFTKEIKQPAYSHTANNGHSHNFKPVGDGLGIKPD